MIKVRIQIPNVGNGSGVIYDTEKQFGLIYVESDKILAAPTKGFETTSYPEQEGVNKDPRTVDKEFEYKVKFLVQGTTLDNANKKIKDFNDLLYTKHGDVNTFKQITFYNDYVKVKIVGIPQPLKVADKFWRDSKGNDTDAVMTELVIEVSKPSLCDFAMI